MKATAVSRNEKPRSQMKSEPIQEELQAATNATLRAHPTSEEAKAIVSTLAAMVEEHAVEQVRGRTGARAPPRSWTTRRGPSSRTSYEHMAENEPDPNPWVYRSMHAKSFTGVSVSYRTFSQLVEVLKRLALLEHVEGHEVSSEHEDTGRFAARFRATPVLLAFCNDRAVDPAKVHDHFEFEYDLPDNVLELRAAKEGDFG